MWYKLYNVDFFSDGKKTDKPKKKLVHAQMSVFTQLNKSESKCAFWSFINNQQGSLSVHFKIIFSMRNFPVENSISMPFNIWNESLFYAMAQWPMHKHRDTMIRLISIVNFIGRIPIDAGYSFIFAEQKTKQHSNVRKLVPSVWFDDFVIVQTL